MGKGTHLTTDLDTQLKTWRSTAGKSQTQVTGMPEDLYNALMFADPLTAKPIFGRMLEVGMGEESKGIFNVETRKAAELLGLVEKDQPYIIGVQRDKDALVMFLLKESTVNV